MRTLVFLMVLSLAGPAFGQKAQLSESEVQAAVDAGIQKRDAYRIGLALEDPSGIFRVTVYTPTTWIQLRAAEAAAQHNEYKPSEDDLRPVLRVGVAPSGPPKAFNSCAPVETVMLQDPSKSTTLKPFLASDDSSTHEGSFGAKFSCGGQYAEFNLDEVGALRANDSFGEFSVVVLLNAQGDVKRYTIRKRDFDKLP